MIARDQDEFAAGSDRVKLFRDTEVLEVGALGEEFPYTCVLELDAAAEYGCVNRRWLIGGLWSGQN